MTADIELLPLPEDTVEWLRQYGVANTAFQMEVIEGWFQAHARAVAEHNVKKRDTEIEALRAEVERLRTLAGCAYQMAGMHDAPLVWLDRLTEAANGDALPDADTLMDELLPYQPDAVCEAEARAERLAEALHLIASPKRPDGTWNLDREACRKIATEALHNHNKENDNG